MDIEQLRRDLYSALAWHTIGNATPEKPRDLDLGSFL